MKKQMHVNRTKHGLHGCEEVPVCYDIPEPELYPLQHAILFCIDADMTFNEMKTALRKPESNIIYQCRNLRENGFIDIRGRKCQHRNRVLTDKGKSYVLRYR